MITLSFSKITTVLGLWVCCVLFVAKAQHFGFSDVLGDHNPWAGSGCNCTSFCDNKCVINGTKPQNLTLYRMTPFGVLNLNEKNSADVPGDVSFIISRRTHAAECVKDPHSWSCQTMVQFEGDNPNSTDLVLEMQVEVDGQYGPYLYCNDLNSSDPLGAWKCTVSLSAGGQIPNYPKTCKADNFTNAFPDVCIGGFPTKTKQVKGFAECCDLAVQEDAPSWTFYNDESTCSVYKHAFHFSKCNNTVTAYSSPPTDYCNCSRVHKTVGKENISLMHNYAAGGEWYSHPSDGECKNGHFVGDGSGCTWRHVQTTSAINASCLYDRVDAAVEAKDPSCFQQCPPHNRSTDCYNTCYYKTILKMTKTELTTPWTVAVSRTAEGCPQVDLSHIEATSYEMPLPVMN